MTDGAPDLVGLLPSGGADRCFSRGRDRSGPAQIAEAGAELDRQRAAEVRAAAAKAADVARLANTRRARNVRKLRRALIAIGGKI